MNLIDNGDPEQSTEFLEEVINAIEGRDLALILAVPALLLVIFSTPRQLQNGLYLDYGSPSFLALWTAAYVHRGVHHFTNNLIAYGLVIPVIYLLLALARRQRMFRYALLSFLLVVPPLIGFANIVVIGQGTGAGFSGVGSALFGFLPLAIFVFIKSRISDNIEESHSVVLFIVVAGGIAIIYDHLIIGGIIFLLSGILIAVHAYLVGLSEIDSVRSELVSNPSYLLLVLFATLLSLISPLLLFPEELANNGNTVNILSHYIGLCLGYFGPTIYATLR